jgi:alkanesulfonate monooxygenase SsuD/methylene tetrahydromethanopterin reductase-like flavin-dependent oxidoreductase (luciferase family)
MKAGVFLLAAKFPGQSDEQVLTATVEAAVAAERAGFDDVWLTEHYFHDLRPPPVICRCCSECTSTTRPSSIGSATTRLLRAGMMFSQPAAIWQPSSLR